MKCDKHTMLLYAVTDRAWVGEQIFFAYIPAQSLFFFGL